MVANSYSCLHSCRHAQGSGSRSAAARGVDAPAAVCRHEDSSVINSGCWWVSWFRGVVYFSMHTDMRKAAAAVGGGGYRGCWHQQQ